MTRIQVESLENRQLLSADAGLTLIDPPAPWIDGWSTEATLNNGVLTIIGTHRRDFVYVGLEGDKLYVEHSTVPPPGMYMPQIMLRDEFDASAVDFLVFRGRSGDDRFENATELGCVAFGGAGADELIGGSAGDFLSGGRGRDTLIGGLGEDWLWGGLGRDLLDGRDGVYDILVGGRRDDELLGDVGLDIMIQGYWFQQIIFVDPPQQLGPLDIVPLPVIELTVSL